MRKRRRKKKERRTILILLAAFLVVAGAVVWVALRGDDGPLLPPEDPAVLAMRASPENSFNVLLEAEKLVPTKPPDRLYPVKGRPGHKGLYDTEPDSIARMLRMIAPDDSPDVIGHLKAMEPAFAKVREALAMPLYLLPLSEEHEWTAPYDSTNRPGALGTLLAAKALHVSRIDGDSERALEYLMLSARLGRRLQDDGPRDHTRRGWGSLRTAIQCGREIVRNCDDPELLRVVAQEWLSLARQPRDLKRCLEESMRVLDAARLRPKTESRRRRFDPGRLIGEAVRSMARRRDMKFLGKNKELLFEAVSLPYPQYRQWLVDHEKFKKHIDAGYTRWLGHHVMMDVHRMVREAARADGMLRAAAIDIALTLHKREKGALPESLDALVPAYLDTMPVDPWSGEPFVYKPVDGDYLLYSVGANGVDDGGRERRGADCVFHKPPEEKKRR